jgi:hypothetical protein
VSVCLSVVLQTETATSRARRSEANHQSSRTPIKELAENLQVLMKKEIRGKLRYSLFWHVTQRRLLDTDVSGDSVGPILRGQAIFDCLTV